MVTSGTLINYIQMSIFDTLEIDSAVLVMRTRALYLGDMRVLLFTVPPAIITAAISVVRNLRRERATSAAHTYIFLVELCNDSGRHNVHWGRFIHSSVRNSGAECVCMPHAYVMKS